MANWDDVVSNRKEFPDDLTIKLADGVEVPLGTIRSGYMKDADYRAKTTAVARQKEELERTWTERAQALQEAESHLMNLARDVVAGRPDMSKQEIQEELTSNPEISKLSAELAEMKKVMQPMAQALLDLDNRWKKSQYDAQVSAHRQKLSELKAADPELNEEELIAWAKENYTPRLDVAYKAWKHDDLVKREVAKAREAAFKEGMDKGREEALMPPALPLQGAGTKTDDTPRPRNIDEAFDAAARDPEIMNILMGRG